MLKYLFNVLYKDGTVYSQNVDDISVTDPKRSCFYDVRVEDVMVFELIGENKSVAVDLREGVFEVNGVEFLAHEDSDLTNFRLIFFRKHRHHFNVALEEKKHEIWYRIGWQANDKDGKNVQRVLVIN